MTTPQEFSVLQVPSADLVVDAVYRGTKNLSHEPLNAIFCCGTAGGFRFQKRDDKSLRYVVLYTSEGDAEWPDRLDLQTGLLVYYGDNKHPGELHSTSRGGNAILRDMFTELQKPVPDRRSIPPVFLFSRGPSGHDKIFRGVAVPGAATTSPMEELVAVWKISDGQRFQNYRALFTILRAGHVSRTWIDDILADRDVLQNAPQPWRLWVETGKYLALAATPSLLHRKREDQLPRDNLQRQLCSIA